MKRTFLILFILIANFASGQNEKVEFNKIIPKYILSSSEHSNKTFKVSENEFSQIDQIIMVLKELNKKENEITSEKFLKKPSDNTLVGYYFETKLKWNSFNQGFEKLKNKKVIKKALKEMPNRYELLAFYYQAIFYDVMNKQSSMHLGNTNIDLDNLNLNDDTEKAIVFLTAMRTLGMQVDSYSKNHFPENCFRAENFVQNMPKFSGKIFYEFKLQEFTDFQMEVDKTKPKVSFKQYYLPYFENAKLEYTKCIELKKSNH